MTDSADVIEGMREALERADRLINWMAGYIGKMAPGSYGNCYQELNEHGIFMNRLRLALPDSKPDNQGGA